MSSRLTRLALTLSATFAFALFLWFSLKWMQNALLPYIVTVNFALMGLAWFVFDIYKPALNYRWFDSGAFEKSGQIYEYAGLLWFREVQRLIGWNKLLGVPSVQMNADSLKQMEYGTRFGEVTHWACLGALLPIAGWSALSMSGNAMIYWGVSAIVLHVYPIMLQRYHRPRFRRLLEKIESRDKRIHVTR